MSKSENKPALAGVSKPSFEKEGIEMKITQNDMIELLAAEYMQSIKDQVNFFHDRIVHLQKIYKEHLEKIAKEEIKAFKKKINKRDLVIDLVNVGGYPVSSDKSKNPDDKTIQQCVSRIHFSEWKHPSGKSHFSVGKSGTCDFYGGPTVIEIKVSGIMKCPPFDFLSGHYVIRKIFNINEVFVNEAKKLHEEIDFYIKSLPSYDFSEASMIREMKNKFTKEFLKSCSPEFKNMLKKGFTLNM